MIGSLPSWFPTISNIVNLIRPAIKAKITYLKYEDTQSSPIAAGTEIIAYVTTCPQRYFAEIELVNRKNVTSYIKQVTLTIDDKLTLNAEPGRPIKLEAHEPLTERFTFPIDDNQDVISDGQFKLIIKPSVGRYTQLKGKLPVE